MFRTIFSRRQRSSNPPPAPPIPGAFPVLPPDKLLEKHSHRLNQIEELVGVSGLHFDTYYRSAIHAYARFVQHLPVFAAEHQSNPRSLLEQTLDVVCAALKIRRFYLLPAGASTEAIAEKKDLWTYAVFVAALCHDLAKPVTDQIITVYDSDRIGAEWDPWTRYIDEQGSWYQMDFFRDSLRSPKAAVNLLLVHRIVPGAGMKWLTGDDAALSQCLACLSGELENAGGMGEIVIKAWEAYAYRGSNPSSRPEESVVRVVLLNKESELKKNNSPPCHVVSATAVNELSVFDKPIRAHDQPNEGYRVASAAAESGGGAGCRADDDQSVHDRQAKSLQELLSVGETIPKKDNVDVGARFLSWLRDGIRDKSIKVNEARARIHVVKEGVLLATPGIFKDCAEAEEHEADWVTIQKRFFKLGLHEKISGGINVHQHSLLTNEKTATITGVLLKDASGVFGSGQIPNPNTDLTKT